MLIVVGVALDTMKQIEAQLKGAGYRLERTDPLLKKNRMMIYIFRPEGKGSE